MQTHETQLSDCSWARNRSQGDLTGLELNPVSQKHCGTTCISLCQAAEADRHGAGRHKLISLGRRGSEKGVSKTGVVLIKTIPNTECQGH